MMAFPQQLAKDLKVVHLHNATRRCSDAVRTTKLLLKEIITKDAHPLRQNVPNPSKIAFFIVFSGNI